RFSVRQVTATLRGQSALARKTARDLAGAVGAEIKIDYRIVISYRCQSRAAIVHTGEGNDEFVRHVAVVGIFHALRWINVLATFSLACDHCIKGLQLAVPFLVAIHGVVAPVHSGNFSYAKLAHLLLQLLDIS